MPSSTKIAGAGSSDSSFGDAAWSNTGNITATDGDPATSETGSSSTTQYLKALEFGFDGSGGVPAGATIDGVEMTVRALGQGGGAVHFFERVRLVIGGAIGSTDRENNEELTGLYVDYDFGGASDLWGELPSANDVRAANFGGVVAFIKGGAPFINRIFDVDSISITVHYTEAAPSGVTPQPIIRGTAPKTPPSIAAQKTSTMLQWAIYVEPTPVIFSIMPGIIQSPRRPGPPPDYIVW